MVHIPRCYLLAFSVLACSACGTSPKLSGPQQRTPALAEPSERELARFLLTPVFDILDCTQQGFIEAGEVDEHLSFMFTPLDRDQSMAITPDEFVLASRSEDRRMQEAVFSLADQNADGRLTVMEYRIRLMSMINSADDNGDGEVTQQELAAMPASGITTSN